jgi:hypothetical protein
MAAKGGQWIFKMLYLCNVNARQRFRLRVVGITPTCTMKFSYVYLEKVPSNDTENNKH